MKIEKELNQWQIICHLKKNFCCFPYTFIFEFGGMGWGEGWFQHPLDLAIDSASRIMVADLFNQRVQVFNSW